MLFRIQARNVRPKSPISPDRYPNLNVTDVRNQMQVSLEPPHTVGQFLSAALDSDYIKQSIVSTIRLELSLTFR